MTTRTLLRTTTCNTKGEAGGIRHQEELGALHEEGDEPAHGNKGGSLRLLHKTSRFKETQTTWMNDEREAKRMRDIEVATRVPSKPMAKGSSARSIVG